MRSGQLDKLWFHKAGGRSLQLWPMRSKSGVWPSSVVKEDIASVKAPWNKSDSLDAGSKLETLLEEKD